MKFIHNERAFMELKVAVERLKNENQGYCSEIFIWMAQVSKSRDDGRQILYYMREHVQDIHKRHLRGTDFTKDVLGGSSTVILL